MRQRQKAIFYLVFFLVAMAVGIYLSLKPWRLYLEQQEKTDQAVQEMQKVEEERKELIKKQSQYDNPVGKEEIIRKRGYRKPEEVPIDN